MDSLELTFRLVAAAATACLVGGYAWAVCSLLKHPDRKKLIHRLLLGSGWPEEAQMKAAYAVALGMLLGLIAVGLYGWLYYSSPEDPSPSDAPVQPRSWGPPRIGS